MHFKKEMEGAHIQYHPVLVSNKKRDDGSIEKFGNMCVWSEHRATTLYDDICMKAFNNDDFAYRCYVPMDDHKLE